MPHTAGDIVRAAAEWVWIPRGSEHRIDGLHMVRHPSRLGGGVRASQVASTADAAAVVDTAIAQTRAWGEPELLVWTSGSDVPDLEHELRSRGAEHVDTVAVLAAPAGQALVETPDDATVEIVRTREQILEADAINVEVWGQSPFDEEGLQIEMREVTAALETGTGFRVLSRIDGRAVSTGGCTIVDDIARLWGAATLPDARGRGSYRAVLAERLRMSIELGATTALVKGRVSTSAPILLHAGFTHYCDERGYRLAV